MGLVVDFDALVAWTGCPDLGADDSRSLPGCQKVCLAALQPHTTTSWRPFHPLPRRPPVRIKESRASSPRHLGRHGAAADPILRHRRVELDEPAGSVPTRRPLAEGGRGVARDSAAGCRVVRTAGAAAPVSNPHRCGYRPVAGCFPGMTVVGDGFPALMSTPDQHENRAVVHVRFMKNPLSLVFGAIHR